MSIHAGSTTHAPAKEDPVQYRTLETLAAAHQQELFREADQRRLARRLRTSLASPSRTVGRGRVAGLRVRLGHALVAVGTVLEAGATEDTAPSH